MSLQMLMALFDDAGGAAADVVTVSGESVSHGTGGAGGAKAGVRFNTDGTVDRRNGGTYTQIDSGTDWVIPNSTYTGTYHIKWEAGTGACDVTPFAVSTWTAMSTGPHEWREEEDGGSSDSCSITISISDDGGSTTLDSAVYSLTADDTP